MLRDLGGLCLILNRPLPEAQVPPQLGSARADTWQLLEQAPGRAAHRALVGLALPGLLPRAVHLLVCPAEERSTQVMQVSLTCRDNQNTLAVMPGGALCFPPMRLRAA